MATHLARGTLVTLRIGDGVHFTTIGGDWWDANMGRAVSTLERLPTRDVCTTMTGLHPSHA